MKMWLYLLSCFVELFFALLLFFLLNAFCRSMLREYASCTADVACLPVHLLYLVLCTVDT